ncbi:MAG: DUF3473 domain-containing protein [Deltaproteobacteria bacterium]|nr:DUF3473 domain-containing protein [Deltaproteobacteria bacterium]
MSLSVKTPNYLPPCITIDVEDWAQSTFDLSLPITQRAADNTQRLLGILEELGIHTTMFVLGKFAEKFPKLVQEIHRLGHEVGNHGYGHVPIFRQTRREFKEDIVRSKDMLEQMIGQQILGYRAPDFSITKQSLWALEVLAETGIKYDSSIFPVLRPHYGIPDWPNHPVRVKLAHDLLITEFPLAALDLLGKRWPIGGGGYHRLVPGFIMRQLAGLHLQQAPFIFYCHPYEFDYREFSQIQWEIPLKMKLHQGLGRRPFGKRFKQFVRKFGGRPVVALMEGHTSWPEITLNCN